MEKAGKKSQTAISLIYHELVARGTPPIVPGVAYEFDAQHSLFEIPADQIEFPLFVYPFYDGIHLQLHRVGDTIKVFCEYGCNLSGRFEELEKELLSLPFKHFVLDAVIHGGPELSSDDISEKINKRDMEGLSIHLLDAKFVDVSLEDRDTATRLKVVHYISAQSSYLRFDNPHVARDGFEAMEALDFFYSTPGAKGAMILEASSCKKKRRLKAMKEDYALTSKERDALPDSAFCYVKETEGKKVRKFPCHDAVHVRNAIARLGGSDLTQDEKAKVYSCIREKAKKFGIAISDKQFTPFVEIMDFSWKKSEHENNYIEITGVAFVPGTHKGQTYTFENLSKMRVSPAFGNNLVYVNYYHGQNESYKIGIVKKFWWDPEHKLKMKDGTESKGAVLFSCLITDSGAVDLIKSGKVVNVSAEIGFNRSANNIPTNIVFEGLAITANPAVKEACIEEVCDECGCKKVENPKIYPVPFPNFPGTTSPYSDEYHPIIVYSNSTGKTDTDSSSSISTSQEKP